MQNKLLTIMFLMAVLTISSCNRHKVYSHYVHIESAEWEKTDTIHFNIPPVKATGSYTSIIGLRIENGYPYQQLALEVNTEIQPGERLVKSSLNCDLIDKQGNIKGSGVSYYQYDFPVDVLELQEGDSIHVSVIHNMNREIMPDVYDVGFSLTH